MESFTEKILITGALGQIGGILNSYRCLPSFVTIQDFNSPSETDSDVNK